jgi:hypothetical protein
VTCPMRSWRTSPVIVMDEALGRRHATVRGTTPVCDPSAVWIRGQLRPVCGPESHEQPRIRPRDCQRFRAFSPAFAGIRAHHTATVAVACGRRSQTRPPTAAPAPAPARAQRHDDGRAAALHTPQPPARPVRRRAGAGGARARPRVPTCASCRSSTVPAPFARCRSAPAPRPSTPSRTSSTKRGTSRSRSVCDPKSGASHPYHRRYWRRSRFRADRRSIRRRGGNSGAREASTEEDHRARPCGTKRIQRASCWTKYLPGHPESSFGFPTPEPTTSSYLAVASVVSGPRRGGGRVRQAPCSGAAYRPTRCPTA